MDFKRKYLKYKNKYLKNKYLLSGGDCNDDNQYCAQNIGIITKDNRASCSVKKGNLPNSELCECLPTTKGDKYRCKGKIIESNVTLKKNIEQKSKKEKKEKKEKIPQKAEKDSLDVNLLQRTKTGIHDQDGPICWAYATATSLRKLYKNLYKTTPLLLASKKKNIQLFELEYETLLRSLTDIYGNEGCDIKPIFNDIVKNNVYLDYINFKVKDLEKYKYYFKYDNISIIIGIVYNHGYLQLLNKELKKNHILHKPTKDIIDYIQRDDLKLVGHAMFIESLGYEDGEYYLKIKNSHSPDFGEDGYLRINIKYLHQYFINENWTDFFIIKPKSFIIEHQPNNPLCICEDSKYNCLFTHNFEQQISNICKILDFKNSKQTECIIRLQTIEHYLLDKPLEFIYDKNSIIDKNNLIKRFCLLPHNEITSKINKDESLEEIIKIYNEFEIKPSIKIDIEFDEFLLKIIELEQMICDIRNCSKLNLYTKQVDLLFYNIDKNTNYMIHHSIIERLKMINEILSKNKDILDWWKKSHINNESDESFTEEEYKSEIKPPFYESFIKYQELISQVTFELNIINTKQESITEEITIIHSEWYKFNVYDTVKYYKKTNYENGFIIKNIDKTIINLTDTFVDANINLDDTLIVEIDNNKLTDDNIKEAVQIWFEKNDEPIKVNNIQIFNKKDLEIICGDITKWNVSNVTIMNSLFEDIIELEDEDLSEWDISNVIVVEKMFSGCKKYKGIGLKQWGTNLNNSITDMSFMFELCTNLDCDLSDWNVINVTTMDYMFHECSNFRGNGLETWNVNKIENMNSTFENCINFNTNLSNWNVNNIKYMGGIFENCTSFTGEGLETWVVRNVEYMNNTFKNCTNFNVNLEKWRPNSLVSINSTFENCISFTGDGLEMWNVSNVKSMEKTFLNCTSFNINLSNWIVSNVKSMIGTFENCTSFTGDGLETWDVSNVLSMNGTFKNCNEFNVNLSNWNVSNVKSMGDTFENCTNFTGDGLENWTTDTLIKMYRTFKNCISFNTNLQKWNINRVDNMISAFENCTNFTGDGLETWNVSNVEYMDSIFTNCNSFNINLSKWKVNNLQSMNKIFENCTNFTGDGLETWDVSNVEYMKFSFTNCNNFNVNLSSWNVSNVQYMNTTFKNCTNFTGDGLENWTTTNLISLNGTFRNCNSFNVNLSNWNVSNVQNMNSTFENCTNFTGKGLDNWTTNNLINMFKTFKNCISFNVNLSNWNVSNVQNMNSTFENCTSFTGDGLETWNVGAVRNMDSTFKNCNSFTGNNLETWNVSGVRSMISTFENCSIFEANLGRWIVNNVVSMDKIFKNCTNFTGKGLDNWNRLNVQNVIEMFEGCDNIILPVWATK